MGAFATPSSASASAWSGKSLVDSTYNQRNGQVVINNSLAADHTFDGLENNQSLGDIITILNRGSKNVTFNAEGSADIAKNRFASSIFVPAGGVAQAYYNGTRWEPYTANQGSITKLVAFTENATNTVHTGTVPIPAGAWLEKIQVLSSALWGAASAVLKVGDAADDDGYFIGVNLKATDLLVGEVLDTDQSESWGGKNGAYLVAASGQRGPVATNFARYYPAGSSITGIITVGTPAVTTGRTFMLVTYSVPTPIAAVPSA